MTRTTFMLMLPLALLVAAGEPARAQGETAACAAPSELTRAGFHLPFLAKSLKEKTPTTILVLNSSTTAKADADAKASAPLPRRFPSFIEDAMKARYPDGGIKLLTRNEPRHTAEEVVAVLPELLAQNKPALLIWQTGTYDAIRGAGLDDFADAIGTGIIAAHAAKTDVIIVSPQFSPRTDFAFDVSPYNATLRWAARANGVPFFDRYALMRYWNEESIFDFDSLRPAPTLFENVHRCIGRLLINMIADGVDTRTLGSR